MQDRKVCLGLSGDPGAISSLLPVRHAASLGLHLGSSAQVLFAGFPNIFKGSIISWLEITFRKERISEVDKEPHCFSAAGSECSQQMVSSCELLPDAENHLAQGHTLPRAAYIR